MLTQKSISAFGLDRSDVTVYKQKIYPTHSGLLKIIDKLAKNQRNLLIFEPTLTHTNIMVQFEQGELTTQLQREINDLILEEASEAAEVLTELECLKNNISCWENNGENDFKYTDEAQEIFNVHYDKKTEELFKLLNLQLKAMHESDLRNVEIGQTLTMGAK